MIRAEAGIVDGDARDVAWAKLSALRSTSLMEFADGEHGRAERAQGGDDRRGCSASRRPSDVAPVDGEDPQRMREAFFSAVRSVIEAMARRNPLVLVFEDIHWADHGMLDLIEYLAQWVRGAAGAAVPGARRAARAPHAAGAEAGATRPRSCSTR